jgi:DNA-binding response OmpR family regulator
MHILIVEDEVGSPILKQGLEEEGYEITTAFDGLQGFEVVQNTSFDLVLLDWMPKMSGWIYAKPLE